MTLTVSIVTWLVSQLNYKSIKTFNGRDFVCYLLIKLHLFLILSSFLHFIVIYKPAQFDVYLFLKFENVPGSCTDVDG